MGKSILKNSDKLTNVLILITILRTLRKNNILAAL